LDLNTFVITGPSTVTLSAGLEVGGSLSTAGGVPYALATQCQTDTFSMTGVPGGTPPVICGTNSGYHSEQMKSYSNQFFSSNDVINSYKLGCIGLLLRKQAFK